SHCAWPEPDEWVGLAEPDGVAAPEFDLWRDGLAELPTDRKIELALELEAAVKAGDPRVVGVRTSQWGDGYGEGAVATSTGLGAWGRARWPRPTASPRPVTASRWAASPTRSTSTSRRPRRSSARPGCWARSS